MTSKSVAEQELHFLAVTKTSEIWRSLSSAIMTIVDEAYFEAGPKGLGFRSMHPSHIALIDISWPDIAFEKYECTSTIKFGLKISDFAKIMKRANPNDLVEVNANIKASDNSLNIKTTGGYIRNYKMNLLTFGNEKSSPLPKLTFDSKMIIGAYTLDKIMADIQVIANNMTIETIAGKSAVTFSGNTDNGDAIIMVDTTNHNDGSDRKEKEDPLYTVQEVIVKENCKSAYNMDYISKIVRALAPSCDTITLEYSSKKPLRLEFVLLNTLKVQFFLAPRIDN
ncbi:MAG: proliferating cell nuclear antigen (pcna) [Nitrososphaeraceae archaeon]|nr:proliferating cell nuclear antigen (pcna) [Nitrososphaeraceae archaeon]